MTDFTDLVVFWHQYFTR